MAAYAAQVVAQESSKRRQHLNNLRLSLERTRFLKKESITDDRKVQIIEAIRQNDVISLFADCIEGDHRNIISVNYFSKTTSSLYCDEHFS